MLNLNLQSLTPSALATRVNTPLKKGLAALAVLSCALGIAVAVAPPAGSVIGNQATATYTDTTGNTRTSTSNLVQTTVAQVNGFSLVATATKTVAPGGTVYFPHTIKNTGNGTDSYTLSTTDIGGGPVGSTLCTGGTPGAATPSGCNIFIYPDLDGNGVADSNVFLTGATPPVAANGTYKFVLGFVWPAGTPATTDEVITLTATSVGTMNNSGSGTAVTATNTDTIKVTLGPVIAVTKALSVTSGARSTASCATPFAASANCINTTVTLSYTNTGGSATSLTITDLIGTGLTAGMRYVPNSGRWSGCSSALTDVATGTENSACLNGGTLITYDFNATTANTVTAVIPNVAPGQTGTLSFDLNISSTAAIGTTTTNNSAGYSYSDGGTTTSGATGFAAYNVASSAGVIANNKTTTLAANTLPADAGEATQTTIDNQVVVALANQGASIYFANAIWNTGSLADTFDITKVSQTFPAGTTIEFYSDTAASCPAVTPTSGTTAPTTLGSLLTDSNGNGVVDTGPVAAPSGTTLGVCKLVWTKVTLLSNTTGGPYNVVKKATSVNDASISNNVTDVLTAITARVVDLTNGAQVGTTTTAQVGTGSGFQGGAITPATVTTNTGVNPGSTTRFNLTVANTTGATGTGDNYDLSAWNNYNAVAVFTSPLGTDDSSNPGYSVGYSVAFFAGVCPASGPATGAAITNTGNIVVGASVNVCAQVTVPANATPGTKDIFFRVESQASVNYTVGGFAGFDVKHDAFVVTSTSVVTITPNRSGSSVPGGNVVYSHQVCNQGNSAAFVGLTSSNTVAGGFNNGLWLDIDNSGTVNTGDVAIPAGGTILVLANGCVNIIDNVFVGAGTAAGATNVTTLTASTSNTAPTTLPTTGTVGTVLNGTVTPAGTVTDTTVVVTGDVTLVKEQREVSCTGTGTPVVASTAGVTAANNTFVAGNMAAKVNPGACIQYRITATNTGATPATNLVITDTTPPYTLLNTASCGVTGSTGTVSAAITAPATGSAGGLSSAAATLASNATVQMVFCVQVDQ
jgi:trimeric autotransporter adhesin